MISKEHTLQRMILRRAEGSGTPDEKYEDCKYLLKDAEKQGVIKYEEWQSWIEFVTKVLDI